jgi:cyclic beta-1,2-glucan synthetase
MKLRPNRIVLAFYSAEEEHAQRAFQAIKGREKACLLGPSTLRVSAVCAPYAAFLLDGESLVVVETVSDRVESLVTTLRLEGSPAIFAIRPDSAVEAPVQPEQNRRGTQTREEILTRLLQNKNELEAARDSLREAARLGHPLTAAAEWILDNSYLIRTQIAEVRRHLPKDYSLRQKASAESGDVNELAAELVASSEHVMGESSLRDAIRAYQVTKPLTIAELWAFPLFLRIALIQKLAVLGIRVSDAQHLRESSYLWANRLGRSASAGDQGFEKMLKALGSEPIAGNACFVTSLAEQLQHEETTLGPLQQWVERRFGKSLIEVVQQEHTEEAANVVATATAFTNLRALSRIDFTRIFEDVSLVEEELHRDPSGVYSRSDFTTRDLCRRAVERTAQFCHLTEREVAARAVQLASTSTGARAGSVSYYLLSDGLTAFEKETGAVIPAITKIFRWILKHPTPFYLSALAGLSLCLTALACLLASDAGVRGGLLFATLAVLALFPLSELASQIVNALVISTLPPDPLPKMDFREGIPPEAATLVVVPMMLSSLEVVSKELEKLEVRFLGNQNPNIYYSLFSDFLDADTPVNERDDALLQAERDGIDSLNLRYAGGRFLLFHRARSFSQSEQRWIGRERKRGKLEELNAFLCGDGHLEILHAGQLAVPISFVITLDADTQLPVESARRLIETAAHPLNRVESFAGTGVRRRGYTIIQPRVSIAHAGVAANRFTRIFAQSTGSDPYSQTVSDSQQDLFLDAIFHGKAIYDVHAFHAITKNRFPAEALLSHDLIEGAHVGVGLATDIELFEHLPADYPGFAARQHRWTRGDWQIARWVLGMVPGGDGKPVENPLSLINRWRILDNLRRSLVPPAGMLLLLTGWLISATPVVWTLLLGLAVVIPALEPLLERLVRRIEGSVHRWQGSTDDLVRAVVMAALLPHQAWISLDAIIRALYRQMVSHRGLLEWQTADRSKAHAKRHMDSCMRQMITVAVLSTILAIILVVKGTFAPTAIFVLLWMASPWLLRWLGKPVASTVLAGLNVADIQYLRTTARRTWRFFDDLVGPGSNWLPPDNTQLALCVEVAQRTSPTNIGLWLTGLLAARDFGYVTADDFCRRATATMDTLQRMEKFEGHLLNWYDTQTLQGLEPRYISTVDSGNFLAMLWVLEQGCKSIPQTPLIGAIARRGLNDTLSILEKACEDDPASTVASRGLRRLLRGSKEGYEVIAHLRTAIGPIRNLEEAQRWDTTEDDESTYWVARISAEFHSWNATADRYLRWMETLALPPDRTLREIGAELVELRRRALQTVPSLDLLAGHTVTRMDLLMEALKGYTGLSKAVASWMDQLTAEYAEARGNASETLRSLEALSSSAALMADSIRMGFLYDEERKLFGVGYTLGSPRVFSSYYDLLASECRLASLVAIAKGDVPLKHWHTLGRPYSYTKEGQALLSWSGTMFEYLMPIMFTRTFTHSILGSACCDAVARQMEYGEANGVPWGVSESSYSALDSHQIYQYKAFGVPALALNPGRDDELVVAPYATVLALMVEPAAATANLRRLAAHGLNGPMGFYEAIDFTRRSKREGEPGVVIYSYMAHHQGMSLVALGNILHRDVMQRRFHSDLRIRSIEILLFERNPITRLARQEPKEKLNPVRAVPDDENSSRTWTEESATPMVHLQGNGHVALMTTNSGGGYVRWNEFDLTRWRSDPTLDPWGTFIYIRDTRSDELWATTVKPFTHKTGESSITFSADRVEMRRRLTGIETVVDLTVAAEDDSVIRRMRITNRSLRKRQLEFTSYMELAMTPHAADTAHPAFAKMFIETEYAEEGVLIAHRRPRAPEDAPIWMGHLLVGAEGPIEYETDRAKFLGRGKTPESAVATRAALSGTAGTVVDPIFSLRCRAVLDPLDHKEFTFVTVVAATKEALLELIHKYQRPESVGRAFEMAWARTQLEFRFLRIGPGAAHRFQELASQLIYPSSRLRPPMDKLSKNRLGQSGLWTFGISGDLPMMVVTVSDIRHMTLIREVLVAHSYWRFRGFKVDLIILNQELPGYEQPLHLELLRQVGAHTSNAGVDKPGGVFLRDWNNMPEDGRNLLMAAAGVVLNGSRGPLRQQLTAAGEPVALPPFIKMEGSVEEPSQPLPFLELPYFNGTGGFTPDGKEYAIYLKPGLQTPAPWINVMANSQFGTMVSESGLGCTWMGNSQTNRLTQWHNDPVSDPQSEVIYLRDEESGVVWTPTALPAREKDAYRARHGHGYTVYEHNSHSIGQELTVFVPLTKDGGGDPVKVCRLRLRNQSSRKRRLTATWFVTWVLGSVREDQQLHILTSRDDVSGALMARQSWKGAYNDHVAFAAASPPATSWSGDRTQFLGRDGSLANPAALGRTRLDNRTGFGADPASALQVYVTLAWDQEVEVTFLLGQSESVESMRDLIRRYQGPEQVEASLTATRDWWSGMLGALIVKTPVLSVDMLLNGWLLYQALSCRFWGRTALYQSSGALGFRDQLQDCLAFVYSAPQLTREHILRAAARQFTEGDVQHWWHAETGMGVRTRCSDDMLWLPFVVAHYVNTTGDTGILDEQVSFLEALILADGEGERMFFPASGAEKYPLWEHCRRALERGLTQGAHGLPLMGTCDWNDGMNLVGAKGQGESVWLGWFLCAVLEEFAQIWQPRDGNQSAQWRRKAAELKAHLDQNAWDGDWYLRGFFDDGSPLGTHANQEARIDSIAQSWSVISGAGEPAKTKRALESAEEHLVHQKERVVLLLAPPFDHSTPNPGYIMGYPPGLRENGGQYTHGALWLALAWARMNEGERAVRLLQMMNPVELTRTPETAAHYRGEPYAAAADVSWGAGREGRCGWTWYTGSAGWMYRVWIEEVLGFQLRGGQLIVRPVLPPDWPRFEITWRHAGTVYEIRVVRGSKESAVSEGVIPLVANGGTVTVEFFVI